MARFSFRTRSPERDQKLDQLRLEGLLQHIRRLQEEIDAERQGLNARYQNAQRSAAFAFETFENGGGEELGIKADELAASMQRCEERIATLDKQFAFLKDMDAQARSDFVRTGTT